jgi:hypothetical protein
VSDAVEAERGDEAPVSSQTLGLPTRRVWPVFVVLAALLCGGGLIVWRQMTAPFPLRVLVAIDVDGYWWEGSKAAAQLADELGEQLTKMGFDPVRAGDPETAAILENAESPEAAAKQLRAAFVISASITPKVYELPIDGGFFEVHIDAPVALRHIGESQAAIETMIHTFSGAKTRERALQYSAESAARHALDVALPAMLEHASVKGIVNGSDVKLIDKLNPGVTFAGARATEMKNAEGAYTDLDARRNDEEQIAKLTFHSAKDADDNLLCVGPEGVLIASAPVWPYFSATSFELLRDTGLETISWRKLDGAHDTTTDKQLWRGYNAFTYPTCASQGRPVAMVEDLYGWARALTILEPGGKPKRLRVEATRKLSEPRVSPDGRAVAVVDKSCRTCQREIAVIDLVSAKEIFRLDDSEMRDIGGYAWLDDSRLMAVCALANPKGGEPSESALWGFDVRDGKRFTLMVTKGYAALRDPASNGTTVVAVHGAAAAIVTLDMSSNEFRSYEVGGRPNAPALSSDGKQVVFELVTKDSPYADIALLDLTSSKVTRITKNQSPDRYPAFSHDGKRILFEARNTDPVFGRKRAVVRIASVPAP